MFIFYCKHAQYYLPFNLLSMYLKLNHILCRYVISIYSRIEFIWPMQPFYKMLFDRSSATGLMYLFNLKRILILNANFLQFQLIKCQPAIVLRSHWNDYARQQFHLTTFHRIIYRKQMLFFEIRTLWPTLNLYGCFVCLRGISSSDRDLETRTSSSLYGLTSFRLVSIVRWYVLLWNNERFLWDGRYVVGIV